MNKPYPFYNNCPEYETMREMVLKSAQRYGDAPAFSYREKASAPEKTVVSFHNFSEDVQALGTELIARGVQNGHCLLIGKLTYQWIVTYFAVLSIGGVLVPLDPEWTAKDLTDTAKKAEASFLICDREISEKAGEICAATGILAPIYTRKSEGETVDTLIALGKERIKQNDTSFMSAPIDPKALALLVFTSGTTGQGKGVMLNQKAILSNIAEGLKIAVIGKKLIGVLPPHHTFGSTVGILAGVCLGSELYISGGIKYFARELQQEQPEGLILVPLFLETFAKKIMAAVKEQGKEKFLTRMLHLSNGMRRVGIDATDSLFKSVRKSFGGKLKVVICGGAPMSKEVFFLFSSLGITLMNGYGITECAPLISVNRNEHIIPGTVGMPIPCDTVKIDAPNEDGEGEICIKGPNVMLGYYKDEAATAAAIDSEGYFHTGDIGKLHKSGYIIITGRMKNLIILSNGKNVYPEEIENDLAGIPCLGDVVVYEGQSRKGMEFNRIVAEVYMDPDAVEKEGIKDVGRFLQPYIDKYNKTAVPYKKIALLRVRTEPFPKNTLRKIVRFKIDKYID